METHIQQLHNRISFIFIVISTFILTFFILLRKPEKTCTDPSPSHPSIIKSHNFVSFPKSSCDTFRREFSTVERHNRRLWSTSAWAKSVSSYTNFFLLLLPHIHNHSRVLLLSAGAGQPVIALRNIGVEDVTAVEVVDSPPLVNRADVHNLPFFDSVFDVAFTAFFAETIFPSRLAEEMVRTVRGGGICVLAVDVCYGDVVEKIVEFFRVVELAGVSNVTLNGFRMVRIVMRNRSLF